jgi:DNA-binding transcriptional LysR family regulator
MQLTRRAEELEAPLQDWLANTSLLLEPPRFEPRSLERRFRVASTDFGVAAVVAPTLHHIAAAAPGVAIDILPFSGDMIARLSSGDIDIIISGLDPDRALTYDRYLFTEDFSCVVGNAHPLAQRPTTDQPLPIDDFLHWPHISFVVSDSEFDRVDQRLGALAARRRVMARLPYFQAAPHLILGSNAIMTLPTRAARDFCRSYDLACLPAPACIGTFGYRLLWNERSRRDPAVQWLGDMFALHCGATDESALAA